MELLDHLVPKYNKHDSSLLTKPLKVTQYYNVLVSLISSLVIQPKTPHFSEFSSIFSQFLALSPPAMKHRKLFPASESNGTTSCSYYCDPNCPFNYNCVPLPGIYYLEPPPPPPSHQSNSTPPYVIIFVALVLSFILFLAFYVIKSKTGWCNSETNEGHQQAQSDGEDEDFVDENRIDHPIWLIHTVGLQQSVINSITVCRYKKGEGLIEGTECSVCLNEFQEDETVRLLPKCNHAFHISCIDTWLSSHINCPMCRAHIVHETVTAPLATTANQNSDSSSLAVDNHTEHTGNDRELGENGERNREDCENRTETEADRILKDNVNANENGALQVIDDSGDDNQALQAQAQTIRRSVSLDSSLAETICLGLADFGLLESCEFSYDQITKDAEKSDSHSNSAIVAKQDGAYSSSFRLTRNSSIVQSLHKDSVSMKRSFSCSGRFLSPLCNSNRNPNAILPL